MFSSSLFLFRDSLFSSVDRVHLDIVRLPSLRERFPSVDYPFVFFSFFFSSHTLYRLIHVFFSFHDQIFSLSSSVTRLSSRPPILAISSSTTRDAKVVDDVCRVCILDITYVRVCIFYIHDHYYLLHTICRDIKTCSSRILLNS